MLGTKRRVRIIKKLGPTAIYLKMFALAVAIVGCGSGDPTTTTASGPDVRGQNTPTVIPPTIRRLENGKTFVRADGWPIPSLGEAEREEFATSIMTSDGRSVEVHSTVIRTDPLPLYVENPLYLIDIGAEKIRINKVKEYRTSAGVFCYRFLANDAIVDENTNKLRTRGALYPYSYYDEDGDGVFESLIISEEDRNRRKGFEIEPHLPDWVSGKRKTINLRRL